MIKEFIQYERDGRQLSPRTCEEYEKDLKSFAIWAKAKNLRWSLVTTADLMAYQTEHKDNSGATTNRRLTVIKQLYNWMISLGMVTANPAEGIQSVINHPRERKTTELMIADEYLIKPCQSREEMDAKLLFSILAESGCRISEVLDLETSDIQIDSLCFYVMGKGQKGRTCFYGKRTAYMLQQHIIKYGDGRLFENLSQRYYRKILTEYFGKIIPGIHPHMLRHSFTTRFFEAGMEIHDLASLLGHSSARTTERYLHLSDEHRQMVYNKYSD